MLDGWMDGRTDGWIWRTLPPVKIPALSFSLFHFPSLLRLQLFPIQQQMRCPDRASFTVSNKTSLNWEWGGEGKIPVFPPLSLGKAQTTCEANHRALPQACCRIHIHQHSPTTLWSSPTPDPSQASEFQEELPPHDNRPLLGRKSEIHMILPTFPTPFLAAGSGARNLPQ